MRLHTSQCKSQVWSQSFPSKVTLFDLAFVADGSVAEGCNVVWEEASGFAKANGLQLHMNGLTRTLLGYPNSWSYPSV